VPIHNARRTILEGLSADLSHSKSGRKAVLGGLEAGSEDHFTGSCALRMTLFLRRPAHAVVGAHVIHIIHTLRALSRASFMVMMVG
jgi:hypothetical protein